MTMTQWQDRSVVVTGGTRGIGRGSRSCSRGAVRRLQEAPGDRQPEADTGARRGVPVPLEGLEDPVLGLVGDAGTRVDDPQFQPVGEGARGDVHGPAGGVVRDGVLDDVGDGPLGSVSGTSSSTLSSGTPARAIGTTSSRSVTRISGTTVPVWRRDMDGGAAVRAPARPDFGPPVRLRRPPVPRRPGPTCS